MTAMAGLTLSAQDTDVINYDENLVPSYTLPELLKTENGKEVKSKRQWERKRRPEVLRLFSDHVYGNLPAEKVKTTYQTVEESENALNGQAIRKQVRITFHNREMERSALLLMYLPREKEKTKGTFLHFNFQGNHTTTTEEAVIPSAYSKRPRANQTSRWPMEKIIRAGYAVATVHYYDFYPDHKDSIGASILPLLGIDSKEELQPTDGNAIAAWAWGYSRILDYLEKDPDVDARRVILAGHSRLGKASLWAGATDERFAIVVSNNSGCGGSALFNRKYGETAARINKLFPHWFCRNFHQYSGKEELLPVDQHQLMALVAPRPLYICSAVEDRWADPKGEFLSAIHAGEVYSLYNMKGLEQTDMPELNHSIGSRIGYHIRTGKHDVTDYDWEQWITFANRWLK